MIFELGVALGRPGLISRMGRKWNYTCGPTDSQVALPRRYPMRLLRHGSTIRTLFVVDDLMQVFLFFVDGELACDARAADGKQIIQRRKHFP